MRAAVEPRVDHRNRTPSAAAASHGAPHRSAADADSEGGAPKKEEDRVTQAAVFTGDSGLDRCDESVWLPPLGGIWVCDDWQPIKLLNEFDGHEICGSPTKERVPFSGNA